MNRKLHGHDVSPGALGIAWMAALLALGTGACAAEVSLAGDFGEPRVIVPAPADEALAHLSWPKVVRAKDGTLVIAYIAGRFHGDHGEGCPAVSISSDASRTFSAPRVLKRYTAAREYTSAGNVALGLAEDGAVVLLSMAYNSTKANTIDGWRSIDSGRTWKAVDVSTLDRSQTGSVYGNVILVPGRGLAVCGHFRQGSRGQTKGLWLAWSDSCGKSWGKPQAISASPWVEPAVTFSQNRFVGLVRVARPENYYVRITSDDFGKTWNTEDRGLVSDHDGPVSMPSPCLVSDPGTPGRLYALASERHQRSAELLGRVVLWTADARRLQWKKLGEVARFPKQLGDRRDITYAWMAPLGGDAWYVVFYCGRTRGPSDIFGLTIHLGTGAGARRGPKSP